MCFDSAVFSALRIHRRAEVLRAAWIVCVRRNSRGYIDSSGLCKRDHGIRQASGGCKPVEELFAGPVDRAEGKSACPQMCPIRQG